MDQTAPKAVRDLEYVFYPRSVAVLGANRVVGTVPHDIFANILKDKFQGVVFPVSPKERSQVSRPISTSSTFPIPSTSLFWFSPAPCATWPWNSAAKRESRPPLSSRQGSGRSDR